MSTELALRTPDTGLDLTSLGNILAKSGYFADTRDAAQAIVKVLAGQELGIGPIAAMTGVYIVNGRVAIGANLMAAAVKRSGRYDYRVAEMTDKVCRIVFLQGGQQIGESAFTLEDAKRAGTKNIDKFPRNMLFARALSNGVRWFAPDVFDATVYTPDELRAGTDGESHERPALPPVPVADPATGEVLDSEPAPPVAAGAVSDPQARYNGKGELWVTFGIEGANVAITAKGVEFPELAYLESGDVVRATYAPAVNRGKTVNLLLAIDGERNADGMTPWEERAAIAGDEGAMFTPTEEAAPAAA